MRQISSIYDLANDEAPTGAEARRRNHEAFRALWHRHGVIVVKPEEILDDWTRQAFINEAEKQYGKRQ